MSKNLKDDFVKSEIDVKDEPLDSSIKNPLHIDDMNYDSELYQKRPEFQNGDSDPLKISENHVKVKDEIADVKVEVFDFDGDDDLNMEVCKEEIETCDFENSFVEMKKPIINDQKRGQETLSFHLSYSSGNNKEDNGLNEEEEDRMQASCSLEGDRVDKRFGCSFCDYECYEESNFVKHLLTHSNTKVFNCTECGYGCNDRDMSRKGCKEFQLKDEEILQYLVAENSDDEDALEVDDEDQIFLTEDVDAGASLVEIEEDARASLVEIEDQAKENLELSEEEPNAENVHKKSCPTFKWKKNKYTPNNFSDVDYNFGKVKIRAGNEEKDSLLAPFEIFNLTNNFEDLVKKIRDESIRYAEQNGTQFTVDDDEIKAYLGINLVMSYHVLPSLRDYWSTDPDMRVFYIANVMPRDRYENIRKNLHFCNNEDQPDRNSAKYDRAYKIRPVMEHLNNSFQKAMNNTKIQSVDEHIIKFKGHNIMKQYIRNKPIRWGFKMWCRTDAKTGYLFEFDLYTGKKSSNSECGLGESVVLELTKAIQGLGCEVYFDNFFNSPMLQYELKNRNTRACGTVRPNRKHLPKSAPLDKNMNRGDIYTESFEGISYVKWMDNRAVHLLTNFISPILTSTVKRRKTGCAEKLDITCPEIVIKYNKNMGGVDLMDQRKVCYELDRKSQIKYYLRLFFALLDISVNNAYIIYTKLHKNKHTAGSLLSSLEYRQVIARSLIGNFSSRMRAIPGSRHVSLKRSMSSHQMEKANIRKRCVNCAKYKMEYRTNNTCSICNVHLCFTNKRNCFAEYHG